MIKTRFAPSPTGYLHVGGLRTALYSYLLAQKNGGKFLLRIEDTDRERFVADGTTNILKSLYWAGIIPDEGVKADNFSDPDETQVIQEGKNGPYIQSERLEIYQTYIKKLLESGDAYYCFCDKDRLEKLREECVKNKVQPKYDGFCKTISLKEAKKRVASGEKFTIRLKIPTGETIFNDLIRGEVKFKNETIDDQVLIKSDGYPTYHFAVVIDDHLMGITHVIRGEEWISSTPKHISLYRAFGWEIPKFAHLPLLLNSDKSKLSKRQGDVAVKDYRDKGYLPEALINFVAFLGWNPGGDRELFTLEELKKEFTFEKIGSSGAVFNIEKLNWYNREYLKKINGTKLVNICLPWIEKEKWYVTNKNLNTKDNNWLEKLFNLEKDRIITLSELPTAIKFIFELPKYKKEDLIWKKNDLSTTEKNLKELKEFLQTVEESNFEQKKLQEITTLWIKEKGYGNGDILYPLRVALSGQKDSPGPFEIADVLGKNEVLKRIDQSLN